MEKKKKDKVKAAFVGFFKAKRFNLDTSKKDVDIIDQEQETYFMPFQVIICNWIIIKKCIFVNNFHS